MARAPRPGLDPGHHAVLQLIAWLPADADPDAELVAELLRIPDAEAARLLDELEAAGCLESATGPRQWLPRGRRGVVLPRPGRHLR
jgi:hypothetical protein